MCPTQPSIAEQKAMVDEALEPLGAKVKSKDLSDAMCDLFSMALNVEQFLHPDAGNPIEHHPVVLKHAMEIARAEVEAGNITWKQAKQLAAIALLHDICPAQKITVTETREASAAERQKLEQERIENRKRHMKRGAEMAAAALRSHIERKGDNIFVPADIEVVSTVISIHDNPTIGKKITAGNRLAVITREADRLWMLCERGILEDLLRAKRKKPDSDINPASREQQLKQVLKNKKRFAEERELYDTKKDGPFCDKETFFRIQQGYIIFQRYCAHWEEVRQGLKK